MTGAIAWNGAARHTLPSAWLLRAGLLIVFIFLGTIFVRVNPVGGDWAPIWVAGKLALANPSSIYDFDVVSTLQHPIVGDLGQRPFVYPPTTLLLAAPLALLPFWPSLYFYVGTSLFIFVRAAGSWSTDRWLLLASLPLVAAAYSGQPSLLVGGFILLGLARLDSHPATAGVLLGLAAVLKPQLLVLAPIALIAGRHWRAILAASVTGVAATILTTLAFGLELWWHWIDSLPRFQALFVGVDPLLRNAVSPNAAALRMGLDTPWVTIAMLLVAVPVVALVYARTGDLRFRLISLVGGALLLAPYAMNYELVLLAPVVLAPRLDRLRALTLPLLWGVSMIGGLSLLGLVAVYLFMLANLVKGTDLAPRQLRVKRGVDVAA